MKVSCKSLCISGSALFCLGALAVPPDAANRYQKIPERNVFGLKEIQPEAQQTKAEPLPALPKLFLTGITTLLGNKIAFFSVQFPAKPGQPATLTVELQQLKPFEGQAKIRLLGLPDKVTAPEKVITSADQTVFFELTVDPKCAPGSFKTLFCAVDVGQGGQVIPHHIASGGILRILPDKREPDKLASAKGKKK